jgi:hypothetical protein
MTVLPADTQVKVETKKQMWAEVDAEATTLRHFKVKSQHWTGLVTLLTMAVTINIQVKGVKEISVR